MFIAVYLPLYWAAWIQGHRWVVFIPFLVLFASFYIVYRKGGRPLVVYVFTTIALASGYSGLIVSYPDDTTMSSVGGTILGVFLGLTFLTNTLVISFRNRDKTEWMLSFLQSIQRMVEIKIPM
ncbi:hypothetical protein RhiJN_20476 [Ceratobasidium sp. AG-Ba]|nr:hypothetical protein RhiJN_20476 [Ceratobasidium sp. AG-Ba]